MTLTLEHHDALTELVNIGVGRAAKALSDLVDTRIELRVPSVAICKFSALTDYLNNQEELLDVSVFQDFRGEITGRAVLAFPKKSGLRLGQLLAEFEEEPEEFDLDLMGLITEVGNIVLNGVLGSLGNALSNGLSYTVPEASVNQQITELVANQGQESVILCDAEFGMAADQFRSSLILIFNLGEVEQALGKLELTVI